MQYFDVHICLVSQQLLPNLLLCCDKNLRPETVVLLVTEAMSSRGELLEQLIRQQGCKVEVIPVDSYDINMLQQQIGELLEQHADKKIAANVTGGNKLMALAVFLETWSNDVPVFYIDTDTDTLWLLGERSQQFPLTDRFKVKLYLQAYGYRILASGEKSIPPALLQLTSELATDFIRWGGAIKTLNYYANKAEGSLNTQISATDLRKVALTQLLNLVAEEKLLCCDEGWLIFADEDARFFANGGWLEQHVFGVVQQLCKEHRIKDVLLNGVVEDIGGTKNEVDVLFTARNRLFMIECKTKNMQIDKSRVDDMIYKLDSLKGLLGGVYGRAMLVSYFPVAEADRQRCRSYNIDLVDGENLKNLRSILCKWVR